MGKLNVFKPASYAWIIDQDHEVTEVERQQGWSRVGTTGPSNAPQVLLAQLIGSDEGKRFRMLTDDDDVVYSGRLLTTQDEPYDYEEDVYHEFAPLDDFGEGDAGCTRIEWYIDGEWKPV